APAPTVAVRLDEIGAELYAVAGEARAGFAALQFDMAVVAVSAAELELVEKAPQRDAAAKVRAGLGEVDGHRLGAVLFLALLVMIVAMAMMMAGAGAERRPVAGIVTLYRDT